MSSKSSMRSDIQGLRGIAVLTVVIYHYWPSLLPGGFVGVDIFFVISGYLITGILLRQIDSGAYSTADFYLRRVKRILPALYVMLAFCLVAGYAISPPDTYVDFVRTAGSTLIFAANIQLYRSIDYFNPLSETNPLLHTWSLAVEEQYYLLLPFLLMALRRKQRIVWMVILGLALTSLAISVYLTDAHPQAAYYLLPTRAHELFIGSLSACYSLRRHDRLDRFFLRLKWPALFVVLACAVVYSHHTPFPGVAALLPCLGTALLLVSPDKDRANPFLSFSGLTYLGDVSYSWYLWHWPLLAFWKQVDLDHAHTGFAKVALFLFSLWMARLSLRWVERPVIHTHRSARTMFGSAALASTGLGVGVIAVALASGFPMRYSAEERAMLAARGDVNPRRADCHSGEGPPLAYIASCTWGDIQASPDVAIWGDSHGAELSVALGKLLVEQHRAVLQVTASACPPVIGFDPLDRPYCKIHNAETVRALNHDQRIRSVVLTLNADGYKGVDLVNGLRQAVQELRDSGKEVVILRQIPLPQDDPPKKIAQARHLGLDISQFGPNVMAYQRKFSVWNTAIMEIAQGLGGKVVDPTASLCGPTFCPLLNAQQELRYFNDSHLSVTGAMDVARQVVQEVRSRDPN